CNELARSAGVAPGIKLAAAQALSGQLVAVERNEEREREALAELAAWGYQFSSHVVPQDDGVLIETGGSQRLFGGHTALERLLRHQLGGIGYRGITAQAVTPRAARVIALARMHGIKVENIAGRLDLERVLAPLPLALLEWDEPTTSTLHLLGLATIGDVLALPREGLAKRFGSARLDQLDRVFGRRADPPLLYEPPPRFASSIELPAELIETEQLMFPARRLLAALEGFLRGRNAGAVELTFRVKHADRRGVPIPTTVFSIALATPERNATRLATLLAERISRVTLPAPATVLSLSVERIHAFAAINASLLPQPSELSLDWLRLAETLHARLGSERVFQLQAVDDHRPERAWMQVPVTPDASAGRAPPAPTSVSTSARPLFVLPAPKSLSTSSDRPEYEGVLRLIAGPERVEAGWWDARSPAAGRPELAVHRDYFVARNDHGQMLWIYRELTAPRGWYLHGFFA
ncbi:MAG: Y-family DNA polymerase, partial [Burkholderiaceae bacterium]